MPFGLLHLRCPFLMHHQIPPSHVLHLMVRVLMSTCMLQEHADVSGAGTSSLFGFLFAMCLVLCLAGVNQPAQVISKPAGGSYRKPSATAQVCVRMLWSWAQSLPNLCRDQSDAQFMTLLMLSVHVLATASPVR